VAIRKPKRRATTKRVSPAKKRVKKKARPKAKAGSGGRAMKIRMYNVGFGDCFLLTVPTSDGPRRILFDCGSIKSGGPSMDDVLEQLWQDCRGADGVPTIDVVVATHRHKDHVSGFSRAEWGNVRVREVWMPWTEHPTDPEAKQIRDIQSKLAMALSASLSAKLQAAPNDDRLLGLQELAMNALSNEEAMTTLHEGFQGSPKRRFFPVKGETTLQITSEVLPGVGIFVLGPSREKDVIRDMDPPVGKSFLRLAGSMSDGDGPPRPFDAGWQTDEKPLLMSMLTLEDEEAIAEVGDLGPAVAVSLDKAINGTSLMLVLKVGSTHLLFPGDAQWGTWLAAMNNSAAGEMLRKTKFYKVGHHGSHNATPKDFVESMMSDGIMSMVSTNKVAKWPDIPKSELIDAFGLKHVKLARSDKPNEADAGAFQVHGNMYVDLDLP
jgi:beta-lactamase superfamily II metal-dependent hydrolase